MLEAGRRFDRRRLPATSWDLRNFLWAPKLGCTGIQRIHLLRNVVVLAGAGVGGGSLNLRQHPLRAAARPSTTTRSGRDITDWRAELAPYYDQARRMLGVTRNPTDDAGRRGHEGGRRGDGRRRHVPSRPGRRVLRRRRRRAGHRGRRPVLRRRGPVPAHGCIAVRRVHDRLPARRQEHPDHNYLYLAERAGAVVHPLTTVTRSPRAAAATTVDTVRTGTWRARRTARTFTAGQVVLAAGAWGTQQLLHRAVEEGNAPKLSARLGVLTRTNSEALARRRAATDPTCWTTPAGSPSRRPSTPTSTPTSSPCATAAGSNAMGLLGDAAVDGGGPVPRWRDVARHGAAPPGRLARTRRCKPVVRAHHHRAGRCSRSTTRSPSYRSAPARPHPADVPPGHGAPNPTWIPVANEAVRRIATRIGGPPAGTRRRRGQRPDDGALPRRLRIGADAADRGDRRLPPGLRPPRAARRRRLRRLGQPRRQPGADDHRPGRAGDGAVAQQGRGRSAAYVGGAVPANRAGRRRIAGGPGASSGAGRHHGPVI